MNTVEQSPQIQRRIASQSRRLLRIVAMSSFVFVAGCAATASDPTPAANATTGDRLAHMHRVPLQRTGQGSALVKAKLNGHDITLLLDTGAQSTVMDLRVAQQLGVRVAPGEFHSIGVGPGMINARQGEVITLDLNGFPAQVRPTLQDFSTMINASRQRSATPTIGLLGYDVLVSYGAIIDLAEGAMYLRKRE